MLQLLLKKVLTSFNFTTEKFKSSTWVQLKNYLYERDPDVSTKELYICKDCRPVLNAGNIPARSVLNGLYTEPVPEELANLGPLENQFIQRTKSFQTVVRLGTYTGKVPIYNRVKAVKGTLFLNQARAWFLEIAFVREVSMRVCMDVCVCVSAPEAINN